MNEFIWLSQNMEDKEIGDAKIREFLCQDNQLLEDVPWVEVEQ